jgi:predicted metal-binding membrane protein
MVFAMMLPLARNSIRNVAFGSLWPRRHRAVALFIAGFLFPWICLGMAAALVRQQSWARNWVVPATMFLLAALWQFTPIQKWAFVDCHRSAALAPSGWRADHDCVCFGARIGASCVANCWLLMLACALTCHSAVAMFGGMGLGLAERLPFRPASKWVVSGSLLLGAYYLMFAIS